MRRSARRQGKPLGSRLDAHADFILALVKAGTKDISLGEIVERLEAARDVRVGITSVWKFLNRHGLTYKKDRACRRAATRGCPPGAANLIKEEVPQFESPECANYIEHAGYEPM